MSQASGRPGRYIEAGLSVPNNIQEAVCNYIIENISGGLVLEDEENSSKTTIRFYIPGEKGIQTRTHINCAGERLDGHRTRHG